MKKISLLIFNLATMFSLGQTGSSSDRFTTLGQATGVSSAGIYYFNLGGTAFDTYVDENGYIQIAVDFGNGGGDLPAGTSLTASARGIMNSTVLATLTSATEVRISTSDGNLDVKSTDATILSKMKNNLPLHKGVADNASNDAWTGTNAVYLTADASCSNSSSSLNQNIIHICGNGSGFHWIPSGGYQREVWNSGEVSDPVAFRLWVRDGNFSLPIELIKFDTDLFNDNTVKLSWETASETNNDYFSVERSKDGKSWKEINKTKGAGNSSEYLFYSTFDNNPLMGISYYRLKQTDFDGKFTYSKIDFVDNNQGSAVAIYPNPATGQITIQGKKVEIEDVKIFNLLGEDVSRFTQEIIKDDEEIKIDLLELKPGVYLVKTLSAINKVYIQ